MIAVPVGSPVTLGAVCGSRAVRFDPCRVRSVELGLASGRALSAPFAEGSREDSDATAPGSPTDRCEPGDQRVVSTDPVPPQKKTGDRDGHPRGRLLVRVGREIKR